MDFSKAFDTARHTTLLGKLAMLDIPDSIYNWLVFFAGHSHSTNITTSIIQGSGLAPAAYVVNAADLVPMNTSNVLLKYADDTYLMVPALSQLDKMRLVITGCAVAPALC